MDPGNKRIRAQSIKLFFKFMEEEAQKQVDLGNISSQIAASKLAKYKKEQMTLSKLERHRYLNMLRRSFAGSVPPMVAVREVQARAVQGRVVERVIIGGGSDADDSDA